jgi:hypothetical protein
MPEIVMAPLSPAANWRNAFSNLRPNLDESSSSLLHLWIFAPSVTQKSRLSGLLWQFAG